MKDEELAGIFYVLVHDYDDDIIKQGRDQIKYKQEQQYLNMYRKINAWAKKADFWVIEERSEKAIKRILKK